MKIEIKEIGDSLGIVLNQEMLSKLKAKAGDSLSVFETENGIEISSCLPELDEEMEAARNVMKTYDHALRELAK